jgi:hypothetical protein
MTVTPYFDKARVSEVNRMKKVYSMVAAAALAGSAAMVPTQDAQAWWGNGWGGGPWYGGGPYGWGGPWGYGGYPGYGWGGYPGYGWGGYPGYGWGGGGPWGWGGYPGYGWGGYPAYTAPAPTAPVGFDRVA